MDKRYGADTTGKSKLKAADEASDRARRAAEHQANIKACDELLRLLKVEAMLSDKSLGQPIEGLPLAPHS